MAQEIIDGKGSGKRAEVNKDGKLEVKSTNISEYASVSLITGKAWQLHFKRTFAAANTYEVVGQIEYTGDNSLVLDNVVCAKQAANLTSGNGQIHFDFAFGSTYVSGGTTQEAFTINAASNENLSATAYTAENSAIVIDETDRKKLFDLVTDTSVGFDFKDALILKKGNILTVKAQAKNIGDIAHFSLFLYEI